MYKFAKLPIETELVSIPSNILVPCPISGIQVKRFACKCCPNCKYFEGLAKLTWADTDEEKEKIKDLSWSRRYAIRCKTIAEWITEEIGE